MKEQLDNFKNNKIQLFKKGQYSNSTHAAYQDLISFAGVSANKVDKVVDISLTQITEIQVDQLLKSTFAKGMAIESRGWHNTRLPQSSQEGVVPIWHFTLIEQPNMIVPIQPKCGF